MNNPLIFYAHNGQLQLQSQTDGHGRRRVGVEIGIAPGGGGGSEVGAFFPTARGCFCYFRVIYTKLRLGSYSWLSLKVLKFKLCRFVCVLAMITSHKSIKRAPA